MKNDMALKRACGKILQVTRNQGVSGCPIIAFETLSYSMGTVMPMWKNRGLHLFRHEESEHNSLASCRFVDPIGYRTQKFDGGTGGLSYYDENFIFNCTKCFI